MVVKEIDPIIISKKHHRLNDEVIRISSVLELINDRDRDRENIEKKIIQGFDISKKYRHKVECV